MLKDRSAGICLVAVVAAAALLVACKKTSPDPAVPGNPDVATGSEREPAFTRAEIRRESPMEIDTTGLGAKAKAVADSVSREAGKDVPVAKAQPAPAQVPPQSAKVEPVSVASPVAEASSGAPVPNETGEWVLQVNVHKSEAEAKAQISKLGKAGIPAYSVPVPTGDANLSGNYWRVRVGRFDSRAAAQTYGKSILEPKGLKFWIDRKSNESRQGT